MMRIWRMLVIAAAALMIGGSGDCSSPARTPGAARADAVKLLRAPVLCEGSSADGYICVDNKGGVVTCPARSDETCKLAAGLPEASRP